MKKKLFILSLALFSSPWLLEAKSDAASCRQEIRPLVKQIRLRVTELQKSEPQVGRGPQVPVGSCASRLRKLAGNFLCCSTFQNTAAIWEEISCLNLKKHYLEQSCECEKRGGYTLDESLQDSILEEYKIFEATRKRLLANGIRNEIIRSYVAQVNRSMDCLNFQTLKILRQSLSSIEAIEFSSD